jgi:hypothetical protein
MYRFLSFMLFCLAWLKSAAFGAAKPQVISPAPVWERRPVRVTFEPDENPKSTYSVRGHAADLVSDDDVEEEKGFAVEKAGGCALTQLSQFEAI